MSIKKQILDAIASRREEITSLARELVAVPTENPPGREYRACVGIITRKLRQLGLDYEVLEVPAARKPKSATGDNLHPRFCILSFYGSGPKTLYFHGHYDVVPASDAAQFHPRIESGKLFGRGSSDMKSGLAAMIYAVKALKDCGVRLRGRLGLCLVPDEETGGARGSAYLARSGRLGKGGIGMLTAEPTGGVIWNANRGAISLRVAVRGKAAHVGLQHQGINAFEHMLQVAGALHKLKAEVESRTTAFRIQPREARRSVLMIGGRVDGGANFNVVPDTCSFTADRRINPEEDLVAEKQRLLALLKKLRRRGIDLDYEILQEGRAAGVAENNPLAEALVASIKDITGKAPRFEMCPGLLENRFYAERAVPALAYGPGLLSVAHSTKEFVRLMDIYDCAAIYAFTAAQLLGAQSAVGSQQ